MKTLYVSRQILAVLLIAVSCLFSLEARSGAAKKASKTLKLLSPPELEIVSVGNKGIRYFRIENGKAFKVAAEGPFSFILKVRGVVEGRLPPQVCASVEAVRDGVFRSGNPFCAAMDTKAAITSRIGVLVTESNFLIFKVPEGTHSYVFSVSSEDVKKFVFKLAIWKKKIEEEYLAAEEKLIPGMKPPEKVASPAMSVQAIAGEGGLKKAGIEIPLVPLVPIVSEREPEKARKGALGEKEETAAGIDRQAAIEIPLVPLVPEPAPEKAAEESKGEGEKQAGKIAAGEAIGIDFAPVALAQSQEEEQRTREKQKAVKAESAREGPETAMNIGREEKERIGGAAARMEKGLSWLRIAGWGALAFGGICGGTGAAFGVMSRSNAKKISDDDKDGVYDITYRDAVRARDKSKDYAMAANVLYGSAGISLAVSAVILSFEYGIFGGKSGEEIGVAPVADGKTAGLSLVFLGSF